MTLYNKATGFAKWKGEPLLVTLSSNQPRLDEEGQPVLDEDDNPIVDVVEIEDNVRYPLSIESKWSNEDLNAVGLYKESQIVSPEIPENKIVVNKTIIDVEGVPTYEYTLADGPTEEELLEQAKASFKQQIDDKFYNVMEGGYQHNFGTPEAPEYGVLQVRKGSADATNWLALKSTCTDQITAGHGDDMCIPPIRTEDNVNHPLSYTDTSAVLEALRVWGGYNLSMTWALKDTLSAATDMESLESFETLIETGITNPTYGLDGWPIHVVV